MKPTVGVKRADKRRTDELTVEVGVMENVKKKLARSLAKRADAQKVEGKRGERRLKLRWGVA